MKTHLLFTFGLALSLFLSACQKKPVASFTTDKDSYLRTQRVYLTSTSTDAYSLVWIVKGPESYENRSSEQYFSFDAGSTGSYEISLSCYSKNGKLISKTSKTINVLSSEGSIVFYTNTAGSGYQIYQNGTYIGNFVGTFFSVPNCGATGAVTYGANIGQYSFDITNNFSGTTKTYNIQIDGGVCKPFLVTF
ncbi:MAG: hypothetical protein V4506_05680 [Bacteroidota bacterium]